MSNQKFDFCVEKNIISCQNNFPPREKNRLWRLSRFGGVLA
nr:MAG TPA: hypothetical protein [Caudoviricetes sp.]